MIHDLWSHSGATKTPDTLHTCVIPEAINHKDPVMHTIFTAKHTVHTVNPQSPLERTRVKKDTVQVHKAMNHHPIHRL